MTNGTYLSKDAILKAMDLEYRDVAVPEWGGTVRIREMSAGDRQRFTMLDAARVKAHENGEQTMGVEATIVSLSLVDASGARLFTDEEIVELERKSSHALKRVYAVAMEISAIDRKAAEEVAKNSETSQSEDSPSA